MNRWVLLFSRISTITLPQPNLTIGCCDIDEFHVYNQSGWYGHRVRSDLGLDKVIKFCDENKYEYHIGMLLDRIGVDGISVNWITEIIPSKFILMLVMSY